MSLPIPSGAGTQFWHYTSLCAASAIAGVDATALAVGSSIPVDELIFGAGANSFLASTPGDIFVTDLGPALAVTSHQLTSIGVFGDRQAVGVSFSQEAAIVQGVHPRLARGHIYTIPANTHLNGRVTERIMALGGD